MAIDLKSLNGPQRKIVRDAFLAAFDESKLDMLLQDMDQRPLGNIVPRHAFEVMVFQLINASKREGWTEQLINAAKRESSNPRIVNLLSTLETSAQIDIAKIDEHVRAYAPETAGLERLVRKDGTFADWGLWTARMMEIGRRICRIEYPLGTQFGGGTGFLVAPDLALTNYHVVERHVHKELDAGQITCRFDFAVGASSSMPVKLAAAWLVDHSEYSPYDPGDNGGLPDHDHLDYALLRLDRAVGEDVANGGKRGWIELRQDFTQPKAKANAFIGQHPNMDPLKLAVGAVMRFNDNSTRVLYDASTEHGSSGSPCFDVGLNCFALHHAGDPDYSRLLGKFNQGIPISPILERMAARGVAKFWL